MPSKVCWETCKLGFSDRGCKNFESNKLISTNSKIFLFILILKGVFCIMDLDIYSKGCCCLADGKCCKNCRANYTDDGCTCRRAPVSYSKKSYGRGGGSSLQCKPNYELNGALCYPTCQDGYVGAGKHI